MAQYIDKVVLAEEIEALKERYRKIKIHNDYEDGLKDGRLIGYEDILYKLNNIDMKEIDLEKEIKDYSYALPHSKTGIPGGWKYSWPEEEVIQIASHFYELGLKSQKGE